MSAFSSAGVERDDRGGRALPEPVASAHGCTLRARDERDAVERDRFVDPHGAGPRELPGRALRRHEAEVAEAHERAVGVPVDRGGRALERPVVGLRG